MACRPAASNASVCLIFLLSVLPCRWYYAGLQPCVHYLPFWQHSEDDVLPLVRALQGSQQNQAVAQRLAANAQTFAAAHFTEDAVYRHWQRVIDRYVELYRGPADPAATTAALTLAEEIGRNASAVGAEVEAKCWAEGGGGCCECAGRGGLAANLPLSPYVVGLQANCPSSSPMPPLPLSPPLPSSAPTGYVGRDAAKAVVNAARQAAKAAVAKAAEAAVWADVPTDTEAGEGGADPTDTSGTGEAAQTDSDAGPSDDVMI